MVVAALALVGELVRTVTRLLVAVMVQTLALVIVVAGVVAVLVQGQVGVTTQVSWIVVLMQYSKEQAIQTWVTTCKYGSCCPAGAPHTLLQVYPYCVT